MKVGDLICYNAAGQRHKTMGLVLDVVEEVALFIPDIDGKRTLKCRILWVLIGDYMPRVAWKTEKEWGVSVTEKKPYWHLVGDWFEVISESR